MLKLYATSLWEEAEYREAEVRLLASLFMASLFSLVLAAIRSVSAREFHSTWISVSVASTLLLCLAFRARRRYEVESIYFAFLSSLPLIQAKTSEEQQMARGNIEATPRTPHNPEPQADA
jgi:hypothetical protein